MEGLLSMGSPPSSLSIYIYIILSFLWGVIWFIKIFGQLLYKFVDVWAVNIYVIYVYRVSRNKCTSLKPTLIKFTKLPLNVTNQTKIGLG